MSHATEGMLQAHLDNEMSDAARSALTAHVAACGSCAAELDELQALNARVAGALALLDEPAPVAAAWRRVQARQPAAPRPHGVMRWRVSLAKAAALVLLVAGAASAVVPGSPVRAWLSDAWERVSARFAGERVADVPPEPAATPAVEAGVSVAPVGGHVSVVLKGAAADAEVRVVLVERELAAVFATDPGVHFSTARGRIEASDLGAAGVVIELPRGVTHGTVEVNGVIAVVKDGPALRARVPAIEASADEIVFHPTQ